MSQVCLPFWLFVCLFVCCNYLVFLFVPIILFVLQSLAMVSRIPSSQVCCLVIDVAPRHFLVAHLFVCLGCYDCYDCWIPFSQVCCPVIDKEPEMWLQDMSKDWNSWHRLSDPSPQVEDCCVFCLFVCLYVCLFACLAPQVLDCTSIILSQIFENTSYFSASEQYVRGNLLKKLSHIRLINLLP